VAVSDDWRPKEIPKTPEEQASIMEAVSSCLLFRGLDTTELNTIVGSMEKREYEKDHVIIKEGDEGDFFYLLQKGQCHIFKSAPDTPDPGALVLEVGPGDGFGELALMYGATRAATVIAQEPITAWALDQMTFKKTLMGLALSRRRMHQSFLRRVKVLAELNEYERAVIADALQVATFSAGEIIVTEGEPGDEFFLVEEGEVLFTKRGITGEVYKRLHSGEYFGEVALMVDEVRQATVTAVTDVKCQKLDRPRFKRLLGPLEKILKKNVGQYRKWMLVRRDSLHRLHASKRTLDISGKS
jgi:cAMP-dependent protein kinase regulator